MDIKKIKKLLLEKLSLQDIYVTGDSNHIDIIAIGNIFINMNEVQKQQTIYTPLMKYILEKKIHAISIKTYSIESWNKNKNK
ncbi:MAG TPA: BolA/IbaG family iron-sulfur metabolism protein [Buchnera sp. (in: enterobacteria)]|nr:BolA/IbaG family iron-sulfur metabolism protein [Buchnera sp. (in: enterobacteria)]